MEQEENPIAESIRTIDEKLELIKKEFESKLKYDEHKNKIIDNLHEELQEYREDLLHKLIRPLIFDIIFTIDNATKNLNVYNKVEESELNPVKLLSLLNGYTEDIEDILYRQGVESYTSEGMQFDALKHKIVKTVDTAEKEKEKMVAESIRKGYIWDGKIVRAEQVAVYIYKPQETSEEEGLLKEEILVEEVVLEEE